MQTRSEIATALTRHRATASVEFPRVAGRRGRRFLASRRMFTGVRVMTSGIIRKTTAVAKRMRALEFSRRGGRLTGMWVGRSGPRAAERSRMKFGRPMPLA